MPIPSVVSSVDDINPTSCSAKLKFVGEYVGRFGKFGPHCWELKESFRNIYCAEIRPLILAHLGGRIGSVANQGSITITAYMIGRRASTAAPTILFVSDGENHRKEARKLIKESGILGQHHGWKTAQASRDPSWGGDLEQLASGPSLINTISLTTPATQVFYNPLRPLRSRGMTLYVSHESGLRVFTASLVRINGNAYYQGPAHAFFCRMNNLFKDHDESLDDLEIDSDDDTQTSVPEDGVSADSIEFYGQHWSSDEGSDESGVSPAEDSDDDNFSQSSFEMDTVDPVRSSALNGLSESGLSQPQNLKAFRPASESIVPSLDSVLLFGTLDRWSLSKDWALVKVSTAPQSPIPAFLNANLEDLSTLTIARKSSARTSVVVYTTSQGRLTGTITGTTSDTWFPFGTSFEEVFSVKLDGPLADGDCGSVVIDSATGELYGHIVAGCRATGFAHVMAAFHTMPELGKLTQIDSKILNEAIPGNSDSEALRRHPKGFPPIEVDKATSGKAKARETCANKLQGSTHELLHENDTVGFACALTDEPAAPQEILDQEHDELKRDDDDYDGNVESQARIYPAPPRSETSHSSTAFAIFETQTTIVISALSNTDWLGYAFGNTNPINTSLNGGETDDNDDVNDTEKDHREIEPEPEEDFFATAAGGGEPVPSHDNVVQDPRVYKLQAFQMRLSTLTQASDSLVRNLAVECEDWIPQVQDYESNQKLLEKFVRLTRVFQHLHQHYTQSIDVWTRFNDESDALYFADFSTHPVAREAWSNIEKSFKKISSLQRRVKLRMKLCTAASEILKLRIAQESNRINLENDGINSKLKKLDLIVSQHREYVSSSAVRSMVAAEESSRAARLNIQLLMLTTAFIITLQYFCSERAVFAFERNPQAFWISIAIFALFPLAGTFALHVFNCIKDTFTWSIKDTLIRIIYGKPDAFAAWPTATPPADTA